MKKKESEEKIDLNSLVVKKLEEFNIDDKTFEIIQDLQFRMQQVEGRKKSKKLKNIPIKKFCIYLRFTK